MSEYHELVARAVDRSIVAEELSRLLPTKIGAYSGNPMPKMTTTPYLLLFQTCQHIQLVKILIAQGRADKRDLESLAIHSALLARHRVDIRDFGFEEIPTFELDNIPSDAAWGRA
jgi:hypothetical protein